MSKQKKPTPPPLMFFNYNEAKALAMGLGMIIQDMQDAINGKTSLYPWLPDVRKDFKDIHAAASSAAAKLEKHAGVDCSLPDYIDGEEKDYFTKES